MMESVDAGLVQSPSAAAVFIQRRCPHGRREVLPLTNSAVWGDGQVTYSIGESSGVTVRPVPNTTTAAARHTETPE